MNVKVRQSLGTELVLGLQLSNDVVAVVVRVNDGELALPIGCIERILDLLRADAQRASLITVNDHIDLRTLNLQVGIYVFQQGRLRELLSKYRRIPIQFSSVCTFQRHLIEAIGGPSSNIDRWRVLQKNFDARNLRYLRSQGIDDLLYAALSLLAGDNMIEDLSGISSTAPGEGCSFKICFPRVAADEVDYAVHDRALLPARGSETVLLVEDEDAVRLFASRVLTEHGYAVIEARNGREALALLGQPDHGIELVLTDLVMPDIGGLELSRHISMAHP